MNNKKQNLETVGQEIYYGGDGANTEGFGVITEIKDAAIIVTMESGRKKSFFKNSLQDKYDGTGMTSFVTRKAYKEWKERMLDFFYSRPRA